MFITKKKILRYDFVTVKVVYQDDQGEDTEGYQVAQVISMIQKHTYVIDNENKRVLDSNEWFFIVQYLDFIHLQDKTSKPHTSHEYISVLEWEKDNSQNKSQFVIDIISLDNIVGSAMVIPCFSFIEKGNKKSNGKIIDTPITGKPSFNDKFWYVDRKFFDRSGWEELKVHNSGDNNSNEINVNNIQSFINNNYVAHAGPEDEEDQYYLSDDEEEY